MIFHFISSEGLELYLDVPAFIGLMMILHHAGFRTPRAAHKPGICRACGYDRAGLEDLAPCPECGLIYSDSQAMREFDRFTQRQARDRRLLLRSGATILLAGFLCFWPVSILASAIAYLPEGRPLSGLWRRTWLDVAGWSHFPFVPLLLIHTFIVWTILLLMSRPPRGTVVVPILTGWLAVLLSSLRPVHWNQGLYVGLVAGTAELEFLIGWLCGFVGVFVVHLLRPRSGSAG